MTYKHYTPLSQARAELKQLWEQLDPNKRISWEEYVETAERIKQMTNN